LAEFAQVPAGEMLAGTGGRAPQPGTGHPVDGRRWPAAGPLLAAAALCALTGVVTLRDPFKHHLTPPCPFHELTGLWCPFCGATRAAWAATHGDVRLMLHANALFPMIVVLFGWSWAAWLGKTTRRWSIPIPKGRAFAWSVAVVLVAFTVSRNLPGFGALAPPS
jgi:hypothetical protein